MTKEQQVKDKKGFTRKDLVSSMRRFKTSGLIAFFLSFLLGLLTTRNIVHIPFFNFASLLPEHAYPLADTLWQDSIKGFLLYNLSAFIFFFIPSFMLAYWGYGKLVNMEDEELLHMRGGKKVEAEELISLIEEDMKKKGDTAALYVGKEKIPIPSKKLNRHYFALGISGSGKSQALYSLLFGNHGIKKRKTVKLTNGIIDMNCTMFIYDRKPEYTQRLYRRGSGKDFLFNPLDKDGLKWDLPRDLKLSDGDLDESMIDFFCQTACPVDASNKNSHFDGQAQGVLKAIIVKVFSMPNATMKTLIDFLQANGEGLQLRNILRVDPNVIKYGLQPSVVNALTLGTGGLDPQGTSVMATINKVIKGISRREFYYEKGDFSLKDFIKTIDDYPDRRIFIMNPKSSAGAYDLYFGLFMTMFFKLSMTVVQEIPRNVIVCFDEIHSIASDGNEALGRKVISEFTYFLSEARSFGYTGIAATQSLASLERIIKTEGMRELFQNCATKILLQYDESTGRKFLTDFIGTQEIRRIKSSFSQSGDVSLDTKNDRLQESDEEKVKAVVLDGELKELKELEAFYITSGMPVTKVNFFYYLPPIITEKEIPRKLPDYDHTTIMKMKNFYRNLATEEQVREQLILQQEQKKLEEKMKIQMNTQS